MSAAALIRPKALCRGGVVGVLAPASPVRREYVERGCAALETHGFRVRLAASLFSRARYTAGTVDERLADFRQLWLDEEVDAIICARGGYGSMELLEHLTPQELSANPKIFMGASDLTAVLCHLGANAGLVCFHGPMVAQKIARGLDESHQWQELMSRTEPGYRFEWSQERILHQGQGEGLLWGGCLSVLTSLVGTPYFPDLTDAVLFVEDTGVKPYQLDRMWQQLRLSGHLGALRGVIFGEMLHCFQHPDQGYELFELVEDMTRPLGVPVVFGFSSGHTEGVAKTLPLGVRVRIDGRGLTLLEAAVR